MSDKILQMFFDIGRWKKAIEKGVLKDIRKDQLIRLTDEHTRMAMADAMIQGKYEIAPRIPRRYRRKTASSVRYTSTSPLTG